jgi:rubrerythrin
MLLPNQKMLDEQINNDEKNKKYKCSECNEIFTPSEIVTEELPSNFNVAGIEGKIPKCPHCGYLHFFGFKEEK